LFVCHEEGWRGGGVEGCLPPIVSAIPCQYSTRLRSNKQKY
jgi:hypothetical protein